MVPSQSPQRLFFVPVDASSPGKNVQAQKLMRTHVMLDRQRKRRLADVEQHHRRLARKESQEDTKNKAADSRTASLTSSASASPVSLGRGDTGLPGRFYDAKDICRFDGKCHKLNEHRDNTPGLEKLIPYEICPRQVIHKYIWFWHGEHIESVCGHRSTAESPKNPTQWLSIIDTDEALVYGQAYSADAHLLFTEAQNTPVHENRFGFKARAITQINKNIAALKGGIDDGTIAAVLALASGVFWEYRSRSELNVHLNGMRKMIQLKGGLSFIESGLLRDLLTL